MVCPVLFLLTAEADGLLSLHATVSSVCAQFGVRVLTTESAGLTKSSSYPRICLQFRV